VLPATKRQLVAMWVAAARCQARFGRSIKIPSSGQNIGQRALVNFLSKFMSPMYEQLVNIW
jgi:hypothetical protein